LKNDGTLGKINEILQKHQGKLTTPSAVIIDNQNVKTTSVGGEKSVLMVTKNKRIQTPHNNKHRWITFVDSCSCSKSA
jgi:hypothetical protein